MEPDTDDTTSTADTATASPARIAQLVDCFGDMLELEQCSDTGLIEVRVRPAGPDEGEYDDDGTLAVCVPLADLYDAIDFAGRFS